LLTPRALKSELPATEAANHAVVASRQRVTRILTQEDPRLLVVVGPCSIHDTEGALEYGAKLITLRKAMRDQMEVVMRVYFEKPRTTIGWKGLINDPHLDGSYDIETGLKRARRLLLELTAMGLPTATEFLDPIIPQYIDDLVTWAAIGARTTESQTHREMASGLSMPIGYKNGTDGGLQIALDATISARIKTVSRALSGRPETRLGTWCCEGDEAGRTMIPQVCARPNSSSHGRDCPRC
jgi:3-deoxy-7-phosphoheptulonate synthase